MKQKKYIPLARCYDEMARGMPIGAKLSRFAQSKKGRFLRNAGWAYQKAASVTRNRAREAYYLELAIRSMQGVLREKLCHHMARCRLIRRQIKKLRERIRYIRLTVLTKRNLRAKVTIRGYRFTRVFWSPPRWSGLVRPGPYRISVKYVGRPAVQRRIVLGKRNVQQVTVSPPLVRRARRAKSRTSSVTRRKVRSARRSLPRTIPRSIAKVSPRKARRPSTRSQVTPKRVPPARRRPSAKLAQVPPTRISPKPVVAARLAPKPRVPLRRMLPRRRVPVRRALAKAKKPQSQRIVPKRRIAKRAPLPTPKPHTAKWPIGPIVLASAAGAIVVGGGITALVGGLNHQGVQSNIPELVNEAVGKTQAERRQLAEAGRSAAAAHSTFTTAETMWTAGWVVAGVGVAGMAGALVWWLATRRAPMTPNAIPAPQRTQGMIFLERGGRE